MDNSELKLLAIFLVVAVLAGGAWYFRDHLLPMEPEPVAIPSTPVPEAVSEPGEPRHPLDPPEMSESAARELVPLPPLDDSDSYFLLELTNLFGSDIEPVLLSDGLVDRFVATIDNLTRSQVSEKTRPVGTLPGAFLADPAGAERHYFLSAENYRRYDSLIGLITRADIDDIVATYRRFYPLFQEAYVRLGYPNAYFNDRVVEVIDHLIAAPQPEEPVRLVRPHVLFEYADPELQSLSSGRKLLIRIGPEHSATIKGRLQEFRDRISVSE